MGFGTIGQGERGKMAAQLQAGNSGYDPRQSRTGNGGLPIDPAPVKLYRAEIEEFSQALLEGREPSNGARIGLENQKVLAAC